MNQSELSLSLAKRFFLTQREAREIIKFILAKISEDLRKDKRVFFRGFGSFNKEKRASRKVRHPKTRKIITIPARITVDFNPSNQLLQNIK